MSTKCYAMVRGSAIRVTGLKSCGSIPEQITYGVSKSITRVTLNEQTDGGGNELLRNEMDEPRLHFVNYAELIRYTTDIEFIRCDPGVLSLVSGVPVVENAVGNIAGFDVNTRLPAKAFAMEVWSKLQSRVLNQSGEGFGEGDFGEDPFGGGEGVYDSCAREYGYTLLPFLKGGYVSGVTFDNGLVSFSLRNAKTRRSSKWGYGPYDLTGQFERLHTPVSGNLMARNFITTAPPPDQTDGVEEFTDVIEGGNAAVTSSDVIDGQFAVTSSDIVEGGYAT
jgi:hypothetical protein